jgi:hydroxymethylpyrimidine pyrophosphatase-like HAD family hydrolase
MYQVAFVDLDDTLFSSLHKQQEHGDLQPAALLRDGTVISYASPQQRAMTAWIRESDLVVPVTARTTEAFQRVLMEFSSYAVVSHGATVLNPDRSVDDEWTEHVDRGLAAEIPVLTGLHEQLQAEYGGIGGLSVRMAGEPGRPAYLMVKDPDKEPEKVRSVSERCVQPWIKSAPGYTYHLNGNNLAVLPPSIGKRAAVAYLIDRLKQEHGDLFIIGAGDSLTDAPFLSLCNAAVLPTHSQAWRAIQSISEGTDL